MYCPQCGQERTSNETSFCSKCGFQLSEIELFLTNSPKSSRLRRGLLQSFLIFASVPVVFIVGQLLDAFVHRDMSTYAIMLSMILIVVGVFRTIYALLFESNALGFTSTSKRKISSIPEPEIGKSLPEGTSVPVQVFMKHEAVTTNQLEPIPSITEPTTRELSRDKT